MNLELRRRLLGLEPTDIIIDARDGNPNSVALMASMYYYGHAHNKKYMTLREALKIKTSLIINANDDITDLTILQCFSNVRNVVCANLKNLQKVILPNSIKYGTFNYNIGFRGCENLQYANWLMSFQEYMGIPIYGYGTTEYTKELVLNGEKVSGEITIPETYINSQGIETPLETIYANLRACVDISSIKLPTTAKELRMNAFLDCTGLKKLILNEGLVTIYQNAISNTGIEELIIPDTVTTIVGSYANYAICSNPSLKKVVLSQNIEDTGWGNFFDCPELSEFDFNNTEKLTAIGKMFLSYNNAITKIVLPNSVTTINQEFMRYSKGVTYVEFGENVTYIGNYCLYQSVKPKILVIRATAPPERDNTERDYFLRETGITAIYVPDDSVDAYKQAWGDFPFKPLSEYVEQEV